MLTLAPRLDVSQAFGFSGEELQLIGDTWCWPGKIKPKVDECHKRLKAERNRAEEELQLRQNKFTEEIDDYLAQARAFGQLDNLDAYADTCLALQARKLRMPHLPGCRGLPTWGLRVHAWRCC